MRRYPVFSIVSIILLLALFAFNFNARQQQTIPDIQMIDIDGNNISLSHYKNNPLLVVFWATDCPGCIKEIPDLIALNKEFAAQGFNILAIALSHDKLSHIQALRSQRQLPYTIVWDQQGTIAQTFNNVRVTPTHFLINPQGEIVLRKIGELNMERLRQALHDMGLSIS